MLHAIFTCFSLKNCLVVVADTALPVESVLKVTFSLFDTGRCFSQTLHFTIYMELVPM